MFASASLVTTLLSIAHNAQLPAQDGSKQSCPPLTAAAPAIVMPPNGSGWLPILKNEGQRIYVKGAIDGISAIIMFDTGAPSTFIEAKFANRIKHTSVTNGNDQQYVASTDIKLGALTFSTGENTAVVSLDNMQKVSAIKEDAVIGFDFLSKVQWQVDVDKGITQFKCSNRSEIKRGIPLTVDRDSARFFVTAYIDDVKLSRTLLDTGGAIDVDLPHYSIVADTLKPLTDTLISWIYRDTLATIAGVRSFRVGSWNEPSAKVTIYKDWIPSDGGSIIGMETLGRYNMIIDGPAQMMQLDPARRPPPRWSNYTGLQTDVSSGRLRVAHLMKGSPSAASGMRVSDTICYINGVRVKDPEATRASLKPTQPGGKLKIRTCNGVSFRITGRAFY